MYGYAGSLPATSTNFFMNKVKQICQTLLKEARYMNAILSKQEQQFLQLHTQARNSEMPDSNTAKFIDRVFNDIRQQTIDYHKKIQELEKTLNHILP